MSRRVRSPREIAELRERALRLYDGGASSFRAVAAALDVHHRSVQRWVSMTDANGVLPVVRFDRHGSGGSSWDREAAEAASLRRRTRRSTIARPEPTERPESHGGAEVRRRRRSRRVGTKLAPLLSGDRVLGVQEPEFPWLTDVTKQRIHMIVAAHAARGVTTSEVLTRLPAAFSAVNPTFVAEFERAMVSERFVQDSQGRWRVGPSLSV